MKANIAATKEHCKHCFDALIAKLYNKALPPYPNTLNDDKVPIFVTWKIKEDLRGCIGTFSPSKLSVILSNYALISALQDDRFDPVDKQEVSKLNVGVSLLVNFQQNKKALEWEVGKHGIIIKSAYKGKNYQATFLPEVAQECNWSRQQTLKQLIKKAGFNGKLQDIIDSISLTTYQSSKANLTYEEYLSMNK